MSSKKVLSSHHLTIRFEQLENNRVTWYVESDQRVEDTQALSLIELAECGAPLAALGTRALWKLCVDGLVFNALEQADTIREGVRKRLMTGPTAQVLEQVPEDATIN